MVKWGLLDYVEFKKIQSENKKLKKENLELKQAVLFYLDCTTLHCAVKFDDSMDKWCKILLDCSFQEAKEKYGDFKYAQRFELEE